MGGDPKGEKDRIENLMAVTREEHIHYGDKRKHKAFLFRKHMQFLQRKRIPFNKQYIQNKINAYETIC